MKRLLLAFLAGFVATLLFHQPMLWLLQQFGITDRGPYVMTPVPPLGVPSVISLAFWGGVWGVVMIPIIERFRGRAAYWIAAIVFGAIFPTLVARFVVMPLKGVSGAGGPIVNMLILGLSVNAAWGLGTAIFYRLFNREASR